MRLRCDGVRVTAIPAPLSFQLQLSGQLDGEWVLQGRLRRVANIAVMGSSLHQLKEIQDQHQNEVPHLTPNCHVHRWREQRELESARTGPGPVYYVFELAPSSAARPIVRVGVDHHPLRRDKPC